MNVENAIHRVLGKEVTLPILCFVLGLILQDIIASSEKRRSPVDAEVTDTEVNETQADQSITDVKWRPVQNMRDNVVPIEEEEKDDYKPWDQTDPYPYKPFKPGEHRLTMGVTTIPVTHWIVLENTYKSRIEKKWELLKTTYKDVIYHLDPAMITDEAVEESADTKSLDARIIITKEDVKQANDGLCETYKNLVSYLTCRFPQYFKILISPTDEFPGLLYNSIMQEYHPVDPYQYLKLSNDAPQGYMYKCYNSKLIPEESTRNLDVLSDEIGYRVLISCDKTRRAHELILCMARLVEEDLLLLSGTASGQFNGEYVLFSGIFAFAAGFNPRDRFLKPLTLIHGPVPEYKRDLKNQMNKFFQSFKFDKLVKRVNYTFQNHDLLYVNSKFTDSRARSLDELHGGKDLHYRSERQTLIKFDTQDPNGFGTVVFGIKTYLWNFKDQFLVNNFYGQPYILDDLEKAVREMNGILGDYKGRSEWGAPLLEILEANKKKLKAT